MVATHLSTTRDVASDQPDRIISAPECADLLGISAATLATWRCKNQYGLRYVKVGRHVKYRLSEVLAWLQTRSRGGGQSANATGEACRAVEGRGADPHANPKPGTKQLFKSLGPEPSQDHTDDQQQLSEEVARQ